MTGDTRAAARGAPRFKPYPKYKESVVEWLGEIPAGWEVKPLKHLTTRMRIAAAGSLLFSFKLSVGTVSLGACLSKPNTLLVGRLRRRKTAGIRKSFRAKRGY